MPARPRECSPGKNHVHFDCGHRKWNWLNSFFKDYSFLLFINNKCLKYHSNVVLMIKLGSFWYFSSNLFIHLVKTSIGTTRYYLPSWGLIIEPWLLKLIMKLKRLWATNLAYSFWPSEDLTNKAISSNVWGFRQSFTEFVF